MDGRKGVKGVPVKIFECEPKAQSEVDLHQVKGVLVGDRDGQLIREQELKVLGHQLFASVFLRVFLLQNLEVCHRIVAQGCLCDRANVVPLSAQEHVVIDSHLGDR